MGKTHEKIDARAVCRDADLPSLAARAGVRNLSKRGKNRTALCPFHHEKTPSFHLHYRNHEWFYICYGCGARGDAIRFMQEVYGVDFRRAVEMIAGDRPPRLDAARPPPRPDPAQEKREAEAAERYRQRLRGEWAAGLPITGHRIGMAYLEQRLTRTDLVAQGNTLQSLRVRRMAYFPSPDSEDNKTLGVWPAILAAVQGPDAAFRCIHLTYLDGGPRKLVLSHPDSGDPLPAKKIRGRVSGGAVRFGGWTWGKPDSDHGDNEVLYVGEGIETALSVLTALRAAGRTDAVVWAALSLWNIDALQLPPCVGRVVLCGDQDEKDLDMADSLRRNVLHKWAQNGREASLALPTIGMDFNNLLQDGVL